MTLVVGLTNETCAVLVSDSLCRWSKDGVWYKDNDPYRKLRVLSNPQFAVGIAGSTSAINFIEEANEEQGRESKWQGAEFQPLVADVKDRIEKRYLDQRFTYNGNLSFLFAGFHNGKPRLFLITAETSEEDKRKVSGVYFLDSKKAIGVEPHGATYLSYQYHSVLLATEQLIALGAFTIKATSMHDPSVDQPIDYVVVSQDKPATIERLSLEDVQELNKRIEKAGQIILEPLPSMCSGKCGPI